MNDSYIAELLADSQVSLDDGMTWLLAQRAELLTIRLRPSSRINLRDYPDHVDWIVVEGVDTPLHPAWVRAIRDTCALFDCAFKFEGWGEWEPYMAVGNNIWQTMDGQCRRLDLDWLDMRTWHEWHDGVGVELAWDEPGVMFLRAGTEGSGRLLDRREHDEVPWEYIPNEHWSLRQRQPCPPYIVTYIGDKATVGE